MLTVIIIGIGYNIANQNFNFQLQQQTADRIYNLTQDLHNIDRKNDQQQDTSLDTILNATKAVDQGIEKSQQQIHNITQMNLNNTFKNKAKISTLLGLERNDTVKLDKLLNQTRPR